MLKGTMKIQLTDVHTGEKKTVVEHNMITNALTELFKPLGLIKAPSKAMILPPHRQTAPFPLSASHTNRVALRDMEVTAPSATAAIIWLSR